MKRITTSDLLGEEQPQPRINALHPFTDSIPAKITQEVSRESKLEKAMASILHEHKQTYEDKAKQNIVLAQFDSKMRRIKAIKSKKYRKMRRMAKQEIMEETNEEKTENAVIERIRKRVPKNLLAQLNDTEVNPEATPLVFEFSNASAASPPNINELFNTEMFTAKFTEEKREAEALDAPVDDKIVLPGWNSWGGLGVETHETKYNTIVKRTEGVLRGDRHDAKRAHVIFNEGASDVDKKFQGSVPYGYTSEEYGMKMEVPVMKELCTSKVYKSQVNKEHFIYRSKHSK